MHRCRSHNVAPFELENGGQFHPGEILHDVQHRFFVRCSARDVSIAFFARQQDQTEGLYFLPKGLVVHWFKPLHNIIYIFELHSETILPDRFPRAQILSETQGKPRCPA